MTKSEFQTNMEISAEMSPEQRSVFIEVIEESLRLSQRTHLFNWLQRGMQYLISHEIMLFGFMSADDVYDYEYLTSSRYFGDEQLNLVLDGQNGIVKKSIAHWRKKKLPLFVTDQEAQVGEFQEHSVISFDEAQVRESELKQFVVHGFGDARTSTSSIVVFGRLSSNNDAQTARMLALLMPYIHCALTQVTASNSVEPMLMNRSEVARKITKRETEVLQWLYMGKTNWEISNILAVSPLTIKNHVQNIIRKLNVENRRQASAKAAKLGLIAAANVVAE